MARSKLGNDPFQRGAAARAEPADETPAKPPEATGEAANRSSRKSRKAAHRAEATPVASDASEPSVTAATVDSLEQAAPSEAAAIAEVAPAAELAAPPEIAPEPVQGACAPLPAPAVDDVITSETAPFPELAVEAKPVKARPRLRLLHFDRAEPAGPLEEKLQEAIESAQKFAQGPTAAATEEVRRMMSFLSGPLSGAQARSAGQGLVARLGEALASAQAGPAKEIDAFGRDPAFEEKALKVLGFFYRQYFRIEVRGIENVPAEGGAILVANHSGAIPWDSAMLKCALAFEHPAKRTLRPLSENLVFHFPFLGTFLNRFGAVRACQENAEALLRAGEAVGVFPEGVKGLAKNFSKRYQLQRFGRGGFVKLAMRANAPIIPVAIVGAEEIHPLITHLVRPVAPLGLPFFPVTPTFPLLGIFGLVPLPTKWIIEFGAPIRYDDAAPADELTVARRTEDVRADIQGRLDRLVAARTGVFF